MPTKTFCPLPWIHVSIRNNGDLRVCCQANVAKDRGILRDSNGDPYNARQSNLDEARNSELLQEIRRSMIEGDHHPVCVRCQREEESGIRSRRQFERQNWEDSVDYKELIANTGSNGALKTEAVPATYYDIRFGNHCNLRCRMCGPTDSDSWYRDQLQVWGPRFRDTHGEVQLKKMPNGSIQPVNDDYSWVDDDGFWTQLNSNIKNIRHIYAVGGEPLLIDKHYDLLQNCIDHGVSKKVVLEYNSNVSTIPDKALSLWDKFKEVRVGASIDGYAAINEYIRYPSKWGKVEHNLTRLNAGSKNIASWIAMTVQAYNVLHLPEMVDWKLKSGLNRINNQRRTPIITTHPLHNPSFLHVQILPLSYKDLVSKRFNEYRKKIKDYDFSGFRFSKNWMVTSIEKILDGYELLMHDKDSSHELPKFWHYSKKLDYIRNQSIELVLPELSEHAKNFLKPQNINEQYRTDNFEDQISARMRSFDQTQIG